VTFSGVARSIDFGGTADYTAFDDITFGSAIPGGIPEQATWALLLLGFGVLGSTLRHRKMKATLSF
jgi:hypothetical protein